jgi:hypothetical protein
MRLRNVVRKAVWGLAIVGLSIPVAPSFAQLSPAQLKAQKDRAAREARDSAAREANARAQIERQRLALQAARARAAARVREAISACQSSGNIIDLGGEFLSGTIEIQTFINDAQDNPYRYRVPAASKICITDGQLAHWSGGSGEGWSVPVVNNFLVTYDPVGNSSRMRSASDYRATFCSDLVSVPRPPTDLKIGHLGWEKGLSTVKVTWELDYRRYLERECW